MQRGVRKVAKGASEGCGSLEGQEHGGMELRHSPRYVHGERARLGRGKERGALGRAEGRVKKVYEQLGLSPLGCSYSKTLTLNLFLKLLPVLTLLNKRGQQPASL
jgi:hypothetical protein